MPFVKIDCGILDSTLWFDREAREVFLTALLMAEPREFNGPQDQIAVGSLENTGWSVPPGWYGFVPASSLGIIHRAKVEEKAGLRAMERLGSPEQESRTPDFDGRRLVRVDGGFLVLNYVKYRERDYTTAERSRRYRLRKRHGVTSKSHAVASRDITQAEVEGEAENVSRTVGSVVAGDGHARPPVRPTSDQTETVPRPPHRGADTPASIQVQAEVQGERRHLEGVLFSRVRSLQEESAGTEWADWSAVQWMRTVTSYERRDGQGTTRGVEDPALLRTLDGVEKSIEDADWWLGKIRKEKGKADG